VKLHTAEVDSKSIEVRKRERVDVTEQRKAAMCRLSLGIYWQLSSTVKEAGEILRLEWDDSNGGRKNEMTIESGGVSVGGGERQKSQILSFPRAGTRKKRPRSWIRELSRQARQYQIVAL
jgi:hypothetical protein